METYCSKCVFVFDDKDPRCRYCMRNPSSPFRKIEAADRFEPISDAYDDGTHGTVQPPALSIERLRELKADCEFALRHGHFIPQTDTKDLQRLIDAEIGRAGT